MEQKIEKLRKRLKVENSRINAKMQKDGKNASSGF